MTVDKVNCNNILFPLHPELLALRDKYDLFCDEQFSVYCASTSLRLSDFSYAQASVGQLILEGKYNLESLIPEISAEIAEIAEIAGINETYIPLLSRYCLIYLLSKVELSEFFDERFTTFAEHGIELFSDILGLYTDINYCKMSKHDTSAILRAHSDILESHFSDYCDSPTSAKAAIIALEIEKYLSLNKICGQRDMEFLRSAAIIKFLTH